MTNLYKIPEIQWLEETSSDTHRSVNTIREYVIRPNSPTNPESKLSYVVCYGGKPQKYFETVAEAREWVETVNYPSVVAEFLEPMSEPTQREQITQAVNTLVKVCHGASKSAGWWTDLATGEPLKRNKGEMLMLMVSELAEAMEADRKNLNDDHLPQYDGVSVELADCMVRICDFVGGFDLKTAEAMADKIEYNANRADHKIENRLKDNGKKY